MRTIVKSILCRAPRVLVLALFASLVAIQFDVSLPDKEPELADLGSLLASGRAAANGLDPYAVYPDSYHWIRFGEVRYSPNRNASISVLLFEQLSRLQPEKLYYAWYALSLASCLLSLFLLSREYRAAVSPLVLVWALSLSGIWSTLDLGQIYLYLLVVSIGAHLLIRHAHPVWAGLLIGVLASIKPNFLVWPALLLLAGQRRTALSAFTVVVLLSVAPVLRYGIDIYRQWFAVLPSDPWVASPDNVSLFGAAARLGVGWSAYAVSAVLLLASAAAAYRWRPDASAIGVLALALAVLASPVAWDGYLLFTLPSFFRGPKLRVSLVIAAILFAVPVSVPMFYGERSTLGLAIFGLIYPLGLTLVVAAAAHDVDRLRRTRQAVEIASAASFP